jgi:hypothetical protein
MKTTALDALITAFENITALSRSLKNGRIPDRNADGKTGALITPTKGCLVRSIPSSSEGYGFSVFSGSDAHHIP